MTSEATRRLAASSPAPPSPPPRPTSAPARAERFLRSPPTPGTRVYGHRAGVLPLSHFALAGTWRVTDEDATAVRDAMLDATFQAAKAYLVLSSAGGRPRTVSVDVDGRRTRDVVVRRQRLYTLVSLPRAGRHALHLRLDPGLSAFAFTFG